MRPWHHYDSVPGHTAKPDRTVPNGEHWAPNAGSGSMFGFQNRVECTMTFTATKGMPRTPATHIVLLL